MRALVSLLLAGGVAAAPAAAADWAAQAAWVGKYPYDRMGGVRLFESPPLAEELRRLVGPEGVRFLGGLHVETPVAREGGTLIAQACRPHACPDANGAVILDTATGGLAVCLWRPAQKGEFEKRWYLSGRAKPIVTRMRGEELRDCFREPAEMVAERPR